MGGFNMILHAEDKNNGRLHRKQMQRFRNLIEDLELHEISLTESLLDQMGKATQPCQELIEPSRLLTEALP
ncbi:LOW QUALITY PROTEIN: hypothetical protein U9M48_023329 [Paspalum notatum var. saurae]|uniref:Uncharacterized protein n=1 Tax=Paspalum notatum var. saurae TaxID=547442 RepID=A0AAQ3TKH6_PASNO